MDYIEFTKEHFETFAPKQKTDEFEHTVFAGRWVTVMPAGLVDPFFEKYKYRRLRALCSQEQIEAVEGKNCRRLRCLADRKETPFGMCCCDICGNKRCPHSDDHRNFCTYSNEPGQVGSRFGEASKPHPQYHCQSCGNIQDVDDECDGCKGHRLALVNPAGVTKDWRNGFGTWYNSTIEDRLNWDRSGTLTHKVYEAGFQAAAIPRDDRIRDLEKVISARDSEIVLIDKMNQIKNSKIHQLESDAGVMRDALRQIASYNDAQHHISAEATESAFDDCLIIAMRSIVEKTGATLLKRFACAESHLARAVELMNELVAHGDCQCEIGMTELCFRCQCEQFINALNPSKVEKGAE